MSQILGLDSRVAYTALVAVVALERGFELAISSRNTSRALARGAVEAGRANYAWMVGIHTLFLVACPAEVWLFGRPWIPSLGVPAALLVAGGMGLRYWVVHELAGRWTTRVVFVPGDHLVVSGPFRYFRHPNYLAVVTELAALPLVHTAWLTALVFSAANAGVLAMRIRVENRLLRELAARGPVPRARRESGG